MVKHGYYLEQLLKENNLKDIKLIDCLNAKN